jgi:hypothetical protein
MGALASDFNRTFVRHESRPVVIGVDFGKMADPTAICVVEAFKVPRPGLKPEYRFEVRHMERMPLSTNYLEVGKRVAEVVRNLEAIPVPANYQPPRLTLIVDGTGVGVSAVDIVRDAVHGTRARLTAATFTHGETLNTRRSQWTVGKAYRVNRLQTLFQTERIKLLANHPEAQAMANELRNYELKQDPDGDLKFGAFKVGMHDDLVTALGLAVLRDRTGSGMWSC